MNRTTVTRRHVCLSLAGLSLAVLTGMPFPAIAAERPEEILQSVYASYGGGAAYEPPYTQDLTKVLSDGENHPGFDFFVDAQDFDKVSAELSLTSESDVRATVQVQVSNFGKVRPLEVDFVKEAGHWRIGNVRYTGPEGFDLRASTGLPPL